MKKTAAATAARNLVKVNAKSMKRIDRKKAVS